MNRLREILVLLELLSDQLKGTDAELGLLHVVDDNTETEEEYQVPDCVREDEPHVILAVEDTDDIEQDTESEEEEDLLGARVDVRMAALVELNGRNYPHDVHEARVELEVIETRAHVVGCAQYSLHYQPDTHCVEQPEMLRDSVILLGIFVFIILFFSFQRVTRFFKYLTDIIIGYFFRMYVYEYDLKILLKFYHVM